MTTKERTDIKAIDRFRFVLGSLLGVAAIIVLSLTGS